MMKFWKNRADIEKNMPFCLFKSEIAIQLFSFHIYNCIPFPYELRAISEIFFTKLTKYKNVRIRNQYAVEF